MFAAFNFFVKKILCILLGIVIFSNIAIAKVNPSDTVKKKKDLLNRSETRMGWSFLAHPSVSYDADKGLQLGLMGHLYNFGDGGIYPEYYQSFFIHAAYSTKRSGIFRASFDSKHLIPDHRLRVELAYLPDALSDFYGLNGYQSVYNAQWCDPKSENYISRAFYKSQRDLLRLTAEMNGPLGGNWHWNVGTGLMGCMIDTVNTSMINGSKANDNLLPEVDGLYEKYKLWRVLTPAEANGGWHPYLRGGLVFDNRDRLQNTHRGMNADIFLTYYAAFGQDKDYNNLMFNVNFRHFVPIYKDWIFFAYRLAAQLTVAGKSPFYLSSFHNNLFTQRQSSDALGGISSLRGILRNRAVAPSFAFANVEMRFKLCQFHIRKEIVHIGLNAFADAGMILFPYKLNETAILENIRKYDPEFLSSGGRLSDYLLFGDEAPIYRPHVSAGIGLKFMMNDNIVLSVDWATACQKADNQKLSNFYVEMGYLF